MKKPSLSGKMHYGHLGHYAKDKNIQRGHNDVPMPSPMMGEEMPEPMPAVKSHKSRNSMAPKMPHGSAMKSMKPKGHSNGY